MQGCYVAGLTMGDALLSALLDSMQQGISLFDRDLNVILMNQPACELLEIPITFLQENNGVERLLRYQIERGDFGPGDHEDLLKVELDRIRAFSDYEYEYAGANGVILDVKGTMISDLGLLTIYTDITRQRAHEVELEMMKAELEEKLKASLKEIRFTRDLLVNAVDAIEDGLIVFDENDNLALANARMQELYPSLKRHLSQRSHVSRIEGFQLGGGDKDSAVSSNMGGFMERKLHDNRWYRIRQSPMTDGGRIAIYSEISGYKEQTGKLQEHTNQLVKMLQKEIALSDTQREFVTMASHEFKTPLAIIDSNAQRIQRRAETLPPEKLIERIGNIRSCVERMQYLINRFMDFSSEEIEGFKIDCRVQTFRKSMEKLCLSHMEMDENVNIVWDLSALPDTANYDANLLDQSVSNVLNNAVKYSRSGSFVKVIAKTNETHYLIEVHDQGVGIPEEEKHKIFNKYFRASTSSGIAGTGIGLNFAQMVVKEHGGRIGVESTVGIGSCFTIYLPKSIAELENDNEKKAS